MSLTLLWPPLFIAALFCCLPFVSGQRFFSLPVAPAWRRGSRARQIRRVYQGCVFGAGLVSAALCLGSLHRPWMVFPAMVLEIAGVLSAWAWGWRQTFRFRTPHAVQRSAALGGDASSLAGLGWLFAAFLPLAATAMYLQARYQELPQIFPVHYNLHGQADHFVVRTPWTVFGPLLAGITVLLLLIASWWAVRYRSAGVADAGQYARLTRRILSGTGWFMAATFSLTALLPCMPHPGHTALQWARGSSGLVLLFVAVLALASGRNASLQAAQAATADEHWKAGLLYFNRNDAALFVPKRIGWGYTLNMAHPAAWWLMALTLGVGGLPLLLRHL